MVFLNIDGVRFSQKAYTDGIHEREFSPLKELIDSFAKAGGSAQPVLSSAVWPENNLVEGAAIVPVGKLIDSSAATLLRHQLLKQKRGYTMKKG